MNNKRNVNILLLVESFVLIAVLLFGLFEGGFELVTGSDKEYEDNTKVTSDNQIRNNTEQISTKSLETTKYTEDRQKFSEQVESKLSEMTVEEKVSQLFFITPEALTGVNEPNNVAGQNTKDAIEKNPVGGLVYASNNFMGENQTSKMLQTVQKFATERLKVPIFLSVEEEGGAEHSPLASINRFEIHASPSEIGVMAVGQNLETAEEYIVNSANYKAEYLKKQGFNMVMSPVADIANAKDNNYDSRTYGNDTAIVSKMVATEASALEKSNIISTLKYFPGKTLATKDYSVYQAGIDADASVIQLSNVIDNEITGDDSMPCSLSENAVETLRKMGFKGVILTDNLSEETITEKYNAGEASVVAMKAGIDMIYMPQDFRAAYQAILKALEDGTLSIEHVENAVGRILTRKYELIEKP